MISVQQTIKLECDFENCDEHEVISGFFEFPMTRENIVDRFLYENRYSGWHLTKDGKLYHDYYEDDES